MLVDFISDEYRAEQGRMHAEHIYGHSGGKWWSHILNNAAEFDCRTWLDYGCGTGKLAENVGRFLSLSEIYEYDPGVPGKDDPFLKPADLVSCIDTLEHVEPDRLNAVLAHLQAVTGKVLFVVIATRLAGKILSDGRNAHLIV